MSLSNPITESTVVPIWFIYEQRKNEWIAEHPGATDREYEAFINALIEELGV